MKELSIKEKAKRYDEAIEKFDVILNLDIVKESGTIFADDVRKILPELAESEDEKIRKELINFCKIAATGQSSILIEDANQFNRWAAWLEKQGEHAKFRDSIQVGDKVTRNEDGVLVNLSQLNRVAKKDEKQGEQKPITNVPPREVILAIWDLGNEWKELTNGSISTEYGTQLDYIQKHWHESEYYLKEKQSEQRPANKVEPKFKR